MHGKEWKRWIYVRQGSLSIFSLLLDCLLTHLEIQLCLFSLLFFKKKHLGFLREVFTLDVFPGCLKEGFHPGIFLFFFSFCFSSLGHLTRFQPKYGTQAPHGGFQLNPYLFSLFQWPNEGGYGTCSTIITILLIFSMNYCFDKGFLYIFSQFPLKINGMDSSCIVLIFTEPLSSHISTT